MDNASALTNFDYDALPSHHRGMVQQRTLEIRDRFGRTAQSIVEIGNRLVEVKEVLGFGAFGKWLTAEFNMSDDTARRMMSVSETFKNRNLRDLTISPSALYLLASDSTPVEVRESFIMQATQGQPVTHKEVKKAVKARPSRDEEIPVPIATPNPAQVEEVGPEEAAPPAKPDSPTASKTPAAPKRSEPTPTQRVESHNAALGAAIADLDRNARAIGDELQITKTGSEYKANNPTTGKIVGYMGTVRVLRDAALALKGNLVVEHPHKRGEWITATTAQRLANDAKSKGGNRV